MLLFMELCNSILYVIGDDLRLIREEDERNFQCSLRNYRDTYRRESSKDLVRSIMLLVKCGDIARIPATSWTSF
jgi:hypothetical protein